MNHEKKKLFYALIILLLIVLGLKVLFWWGEKTFKDLTDKTVDTFHENISQTSRAAYEAEDFTSLPGGVKEYLQKAMPLQGLHIKSVRITQRGDIRVHDEASWKAFSAVQHVSANPPQLVWSANPEHWPLTPLGILTTYLKRKSMKRIKKV